MALQLHINQRITQRINQPHVASPTWSSTEQVARPAIRNDSTRLTGDLWGRAVDRGHGGATTRRPRRLRDDDKP